MGNDTISVGKCEIEFFSEKSPIGESHLGIAMVKSKLAC